MKEMDLRSHKHYYFWYIFLLVMYNKVIACTNFTVIYDQIFHPQLQKNFKPENFSYVNFLSINSQGQNVNLKNITSCLNEINKDNVVILFTKHDGFFQHILRNQRLVLSYGLSLQDLGSNHHLQNSFCLQLNHSLQQALTALVGNIPNPQIAAITDEDECSKNFFLSLESSLLSSKNISDSSPVIKKHIVYHKYYSQFHQHNNSILDELKLLDFNVVILLTERRIVPVILREASILGITTNLVTWLVPFYEDQLSLSHQFPQKLLSFQLKEQSYFKNPYERLFIGVTEMMMLYEKLKNDVSSAEISIQMYQTLQRIEEEKYKEGLHLNILLRGNLEEIAKTLNVANQEELYIVENEIKTIQISNETPLRHLRAVTILDEPWTYERKELYDQDRDMCNSGLKCQKLVERNNTKTYIITCCFGYTVDVFMLILEYTELEYNLYIVEDGKYGGIREDGQWNGIINDLIIGKADLAVATLTMIKNRAEVVDFTSDLLTIQMGILYKPQMTKINFINFEFLSFLTNKLQWSLLTVVAGTLVLVYLSENAVYFFNSISVRSTLQKYFSMYESLTYIGGVTLQRDLGGLIPKRFGARLTAIAFAFCMMVFVTNYTAMLAATSIQYVEKNPFIGFMDQRMRNPSKEFKFATIKDTSYSTRFKFSENPVFRKMSWFMEKYNLETPLEGVKKVASGELQALIYDVSVLTWLVQKHKFCELKLLRDEMAQVVISFATKKNFKWTQSINKAIEHYNENKMLPPLYHKWVPSGCTPPPLLAPRNINDFGGLILILCITSIVCIPVLVIEHFYERCCIISRRRRTNHL